MRTAESVRAFEDDSVTHRIIGAAIEVHRLLGPGLLEGTYEECLCHEFAVRRIPFERQVALPLSYKELNLTRAYKLDLVVDETVIVELKAVDRMLPLYEAQLLTYLRLSGLGCGLLINFNAVPFKSGIRRLNKTKFSPVSPVSFPPDTE